jgi:hypothetical protein
VQTLNQRAGSWPARRRTAPTARPPASVNPFWDCRFSRGEFWLLGFVITSAILLHLGPVLHSSAGVPLLYALAVVSYFSPVTGFLFVACGQFLPFPDTSPHNPAQVGVLVWLPVTLLKYHRVRLTGLGLLWPVFPFLLWFFALTGEAIYLPSGDYMKTLFYCVITCQLANEAQGKYLKCLFGLCLGAILIMIAYWAQELGLPIEIKDWGGDREGFARMGGVRADSVLVWPALLMGISGLLGIQIAFASKSAPHPSPKWLTNICLGLTMASLPPLVSTMCHGAFAGLAAVVMALSLAIWMVARDGAMGQPRFRQLIRWCLYGILGVAMMFVCDAFQIRTKMVALDKFHAEQSKELGGQLASRTGVWHDAVNTIMKYPLFGIRVTGEKEVITSEYAATGGYLSHNVFLDYGRYCGIPGMLLLGFFFFRPVILMFKSGRVVQYLPFILAHFSMFIFWMSLSFQFYKTFWSLWMLMIMTVSMSAPASAARVSNSPLAQRRPARRLVSMNRPSGAGTS